MELDEIKNIIQRWEKLYDAVYSVTKTFPEIANVELFFKKDLLGAKNFKYVDNLLSQIEEIDTKFRLECEQRKANEQINRIRVEIEKVLLETTWSMLADAPLSNEGKKLYRDYRQYIRDIPDLWKRKQILELKVMSFEEWRKNPPKYKVERKVIL